MAIGSKVKMRVVGYVEDDMGQAVIVDNPYSKNKHPHVTLTTSGDIKPNYSNELIAKGDVEVIREDIILNGTIGVFEDGKVINEDAEWNRFKKQGLGPQNSAYRTVVRVNPKCKKFPYCSQGDSGEDNLIFDDLDDIKDRNITWVAENLAKYLIKREK